MKHEDHRAQVLRTFEKEVSRDSARTHIYPFSELGLVQMTRKRTRESLGHILCEPCPQCEGRGVVKTVETVGHEIAREVQRAARQYDPKSFLVLAAPRVIDYLREGQAAGMAELEAALKRPIKLQAETLYTQEQFDVVPV
jgi:ribonuclease G